MVWYQDDLTEAVKETEKEFEKITTSQVNTVTASVNRCSETYQEMNTETHGPAVYCGKTRTGN